MQPSYMSPSSFWYWSSALANTDLIPGTLYAIPEQFSKVRGMLLTATVTSTSFSLILTAFKSKLGPCDVCSMLCSGGNCLQWSLHACNLVDKSFTLHPFYCSRQQQGCAKRCISCTIPCDASCGMRLACSAVLVYNGLLQWSRRFSGPTNSSHIPAHKDRLSWC